MCNFERFKHKNCCLILKLKKNPTSTLFCSIVFSHKTLCVLFVYWFQIFFFVLLQIRWWSRGNVAAVKQRKCINATKKWNSNVINSAEEIWIAAFTNAKSHAIRELVTIAPKKSNRRATVSQKIEPFHAQKRTKNLCTIRVVVCATSNSSVITTSARIFAMLVIAMIVNCCRMLWSGVRVERHRLKKISERVARIRFHCAHRRAKSDWRVVNRAIRTLVWANVILVRVHHAINKRPSSVGKDTFANILN